MKNILYRIFSVMLMVTLAAGAVQAQTLKKNSARKNPPKVTVQAKQSNNSRVHVLPAKSFARTPFKKAAKTVSASNVNVKKATPAYSAAGEVPTINGVCIFSNTWTQDNSAPGLYELPRNASSTSEMLVTDVSGSYGGVEIDGLFYSTSYVNYGFFAFGYITVYDIETGQAVAENSNITTDCLAVGLTKDSVTSNIYGITYNSDGSALQFSILNYSEDGSVTSTKIADIDGNWNSLVCDASGQLYGIRYTVNNETVTNSTLCKIDKTTGAVTEVGACGVDSQFLTGATIDTKTNRMYWAVCPIDETGNLYEVNLTTGAATKLYQFNDDAEYVSLYVPAPKAEDGAPAECTNVAANFLNGGLSGNITLTTPSTLYDGTPGSGNITIHVLANSQQIATQYAAYGENVTIPVAPGEAGSYDFVVYASNTVGDGPKTKLNNVFVGVDTPAATKATLTYSNGVMNVNWTAVTSSVNGGYIDLSTLTYTVKDAEGNVKASGLTGTSWSENYPEPANMEVVYYTVTAVAGGIESAPANTNTVTAGAAVPPYTSNFAEIGLTGWTVIDNNGDGTTWKVSDGKAAIQYNMDLDMDDWLISVPLKLEKGKTYAVSFDANSYSASYPERLEVKYGTSPTVAGMTNALVSSTEIATSEPTAINAALKPTADGIYYIGIHGISDADEWTLFVGDLTIEAGIAATAPGAPSDLVVTPDPAGALKATVSFKAPTQNMQGDALNTLNKVEVFRDGTLINTFNNPAIGGALSCEDVLTEKGNHTYEVYGTNDNGAGVKAQASVYVGYSDPADMQTVNIARTSVEGEVLLTWDAVTTDINGLAYPAGKVTYSVYAMDGYVRTLISDNISSTSYTFQAVDAGEQEFVQYAVCAVVDGVEGALNLSELIPVGTPYAGLEESFGGGTLNYEWATYSIDGGSLELINDESGIPSQDGDNGSVAITGQYLETGAELISGMVSLNQMVNPGLSFYTFDIETVADAGSGADVNEITVFVKAIDDEEYTTMFNGTVEDICEGSTDGWGKVFVDLSQFANKVIEFKIQGIVMSYAYIPIDNMRVGSTLDKDLKAAGISAPAKVVAGGEYEVSVTVANEGMEAAAAYSVELYKDEVLVETHEGSDLASGSRVAVPFIQTMSVLATEDVTYYAKVVYSGDENESNNQTSDITVSPVVSNYPKATDLSAQTEDTGISLTWTAPNLEAGVPEPVTFDFEDADSFTAEYGDFIFVDGDKSAVGGFQDMNLPGITPGETLGSFWIWDTDVAGNQTFAAHSGTHYLFSLFRYDSGASDEWAITPELDGSAQDITFYAKSYSSQYPESIEVYYSTGSTEPSDFVKIDGGGVVPGDWTLYTASVPAGAKRFAIRSMATDSFMLMIDDMTFTPADAVANLEIEGYNIYRDGEKINATPVTETSYLDNTVVYGETYTYVVTVVYKQRGESGASNEATIKQTGLDDIYGGVKVAVEGSNIVVYNASDVSVVAANGSVLYAGKCGDKVSVAVMPGVYVVKADYKIVKVAVK